MHALATLRRVLGEVDAIFEHARTGRDPRVMRAPAPRVDASKVDGWYNFQAEADYRRHSR